MKKGHPSKINRAVLECIYSQYNRRKLVHPDPLEFLYDYDELKDREIVAVLASSLAYGRVAQILKSVSSVLSRMEPSPYEFVMSVSKNELVGRFENFKHRFTTGDEIAALLFALKGVIKEFGSLYAFFKTSIGKGDEDVLPSICSFVGELARHGCQSSNSLVASPSDKSACKRMNLFMRWMVRRDDVDPGGWDDIGTSQLVVPIDVHMHKICRALGLVERKQADLRTALEVTARFKEMCPEDPVRYDFALTRFGIRDDEDYDSLYKKCGMVI